MTGMLGVYLTAVELVKRGFIVSPTSRSAVGADLLVTDQRCQITWSVQVKTNATMANFWLTGSKAKDFASPSHIYVFMSAPKEKQPQFYVVPSSVVAPAIKESPPGWYAFYRDDEYKDKWELFGDPMGSVPTDEQA
jgi:hypothetical protein